MRPLGVQLPTQAQLRLARRVLPHVPAAGLAWLRAVGWAGRRRVLGRTEQRELWLDRPDGVRVRGVLHPVRSSRAAVLAVGGSTGGLAAVLRRVSRTARIGLQRGTANWLFA